MFRTNDRSRTTFRGRLRRRGHGRPRRPVWAAVASTIAVMAGILVFVAPPAGASWAEVKVVIERVHQGGCTDSTSGSDFYGRTTIGGTVFNHREISGRDTAYPNHGWDAQETIDLDTATSVPATIEIFEADGELNFGNDSCDIDEGPDRVLDLNVDLLPCAVTGDAPGACSTTITTNGNGQGDGNAEVDFRIEVTNLPPAPYSGPVEVSLTVSEAHINHPDCVDPIEFPPGCNSDADFFEKVNIGGVTTSNLDQNDQDMLEDENRIRPYSTFARIVPGSQTNVPIHLELWDDDTPLPHELLDINPVDAEHEPGIDLSVNIQTCEVSGAVTGHCARSAPAGQTGDTFESEGLDGDEGTLDIEADTDAHIEFYVEVTLCPVAEYLGDEPDDVIDVWTGNDSLFAHNPRDPSLPNTGHLQGVAHNSDRKWIFTNDEGIFTTERDYTNPEFRYHKHPYWEELGYNHYGDPDVADEFLFVPTTGDGDAVDHPILLVFDAVTFDLFGAIKLREASAAITEAELQSPRGNDIQEQKGAGWVAVDPRREAGGPIVLYTSNNNLDDTRGIIRYRIDDPTMLTGDGKADLTPKVTFVDHTSLYEADGTTPIDGAFLASSPLLSMQGGAVTPWGDLYLQNGKGGVGADVEDFQRAGIHVFRDGRLVTQAQQAPGSPFRYEFHQGINPLEGGGDLGTLELEEPEGLDWWDAPKGEAELGGQLHALVSDHDPPGPSDVFFKHYDITCPPNLGLQLTGQPAQLEPGADTITLQATVTNSNARDAAGTGFGVPVDGFELSTTLSTPNDLISADPPTAGCDDNEPALIFCHVEQDLAPGESIVVTMVVRLLPAGFTYSANSLHVESQIDPLDSVRDADIFDNTAELNIPINVNCEGVPATILGTAGPDNLTGTAGIDVIYTGPGNDTINGAGGADIICGGAGADVIRGGPGNDRLHGEAGVDIVYGEGGDDYLTGGLEGDQLLGGPDNDAMLGGPGNDRLVGSDLQPRCSLLVVRPCNPLPDLSGVRDQVQYWDTPAHPGVVPLGATVNLSTGVATGNGTDTIIDVDDIVGSQTDDVLIGNNGQNVFRPLEGNDSMDGAGAADDTLDFDWRPFNAVQVDLQSGVSIGPGHRGTLKRIENVGGTSMGDTLRGDGANNLLVGYDGADVIDGRKGDDTLYGMGGSDTLTGGPGRDTADPGAGPNVCTDIIENLLAPC